MQRGVVIISLDCEGCGPSHRLHGLKSLGYYIGTPDGVFLERGRFDFAPLEGQFPDPNTLKDFYHTKNPGLWEELSANAKPAHAQMHAFNSLLTRYELTHDLYILCDAPSYDFSLINYYLDYFNLPLLHFTRAGVFRSVHDADSYARGVEHKKANEPEIENAAIRTKYGIQLPSGLKAHLPEDDAEQIYRTHIGLVNRL
jgi:hypothetical protein